MSAPTIPDYVACIPILNDSNINEKKNFPLIYNQSWSETLHDIIFNFCRKNNILKECNQLIPKSIFDVIAQFYSNDMTKYRSYEDYVNAILICKYFSSLKRIKSPDNENDLSVRKKYKLTAKASLTTKKIFQALKDYKCDKFKIFNGEKIDNFEILFVDHNINKHNLQQYSYPKDINYNITMDELKIITAIRDTIKLNETQDTDFIYFTYELQDILKKGNFKSGKSSIRLHTIIEYRNKAMFAIDYSFKYPYFLFVFKFFTIIIHDNVAAQERHTTRTMEARVIANRYRGILEQLDKSGL